MSPLWCGGLNSGVLFHMVWFTLSLNLSFQNHAVTASVLLDSREQPARSPIRKVRSLWELVRKGKSREFQRIIQKGKKSIGDVGLGDGYYEIWGPSRLLILYFIVFIPKSASSHRTISAWHLQVVSLNHSGMLTFFFFFLTELLFSPQNPA